MPTKTRMNSNCEHGESDDGDNLLALSVLLLLLASSGEFDSYHTNDSEEVI